MESITLLFSPKTTGAVWSSSKVQGSDVNKAQNVGGKMDFTLCFITIWIDTSDAVLLIKLSLTMNIVLIMLEFNLVINSSQTGEETDFILVSCTGLGIEPTRREQVLKAKKVCHFFSPFSPILLFKFLCI